MASKTNKKVDETFESTSVGRWFSALGPGPRKWAIFGLGVATGFWVVPLLVKLTHLATQ